MVNTAKNICYLALSRKCLSTLTLVYICFHIWVVCLPSQIYSQIYYCCYCNCIILIINCVNRWNRRSKRELLWEILLLVPKYSPSLPLVIESQVSAGWWPLVIDLHFLGSLAARHGHVTVFQPVGSRLKLCMQLTGHDFQGNQSALLIPFPLPAGCDQGWGWQELSNYLGLWDGRMMLRESGQQDKVSLYLQH